MLFASLLIVGGSAVAPVPTFANAPIPGSCIPNEHRVVAPGCPAAVAGDVRDPEITLPDLVPDVRFVAIRRGPLWDPTLETPDEEPAELWFDTRAQNEGVVPLELAIDDASTFPEPRAAQCISWTADHVCRRRAPSGGFAWHQEHGHFHFLDFARYELRRVAADGRADRSPGGLIAESDKVSFCLVDYEQARSDAFPVAKYRECQPGLQGISPGWADVYTMELPGQRFGIEGLPDGFYALIVTMDASDHVREMDDTNNRVEVILELADGLRTVRIVAKHQS